MPAKRSTKKSKGTARARRSARYALAEQVGFLLRLAQQRHTAIFAALMTEGLTPTQWAALAKLKEIGPSSQNLLGRQTAMDAATIKGVIDRLRKRGFAATRPDPADGRRLLVALTADGAAVYDRVRPIAARITEETLVPLNERQRAELLALLGKLT
jgi:MarR family transcriptional regulator, lower aerobic nicotinate degradation pathway regulator